MSPSSQAMLQCSFLLPTEMEIWPGFATMQCALLRAEVAVSSTERLQQELNAGSHYRLLDIFKIDKKLREPWMLSDLESNWFARTEKLGVEGSMTQWHVMTLAKGQWLISPKIKVTVHTQKINTDHNLSSVHVTLMWTIIYSNTFILFKTQGLLSRSLSN